jgi:hypothetical protein
VCARSLSAVTGQRGGARPARRRDPMSGVVLVVAVVLLARGGADPPGGGASSVAVPRWSTVCSKTSFPSLWMLYG